MQLRTESDILDIIRNDDWMIGIIHTASRLHLPDWWICAGFVRSKIWDALHGFEERTPLADVDVVYFDPEHTDESSEKRYERELLQLRPDIPWSVKNQARMHVLNDNPPYRSAVDGIGHFTETATALGVKTDYAGELLLAAPHGIEDVLQLRVKPSPHCRTSPRLLAVYDKRVADKRWKERWHLLTYVPAGPDERQPQG